jgi:hypothetical protein
MNILVKNLLKILLKPIVKPWHRSLKDPGKAQELVLEDLVKVYAQNEYGKAHNSANVGSYIDYVNAFPVKSYDDYKPLIDQVLAGDTHVLLSEEPIAIGRTRGTTTGTSKNIPITITLAKTARVSERATANYMLSKNQYDFLEGYTLNTANRSNLEKVVIGDRELDVGYSAGHYFKMYQESKKAKESRFIPTQEEINEFGGGSTKEDWEARHEFVYRKAKDKNITYLVGVVPNVIYFAEYLFNSHNLYPKDLWTFQFLHLSSMPGINTRRAPLLHEYYGDAADIRELYAASEGFMGAQIDDNRAWVPFYDSLFFEVETDKGVKQLHQMVPGEIGSMILSTPVFPRYRIGDLILCVDPPYYRCIGRENTKLEPYENEPL